MTIWLDAQLSPRLARWINANFLSVQAFPLRDIGLRDARDEAIFAAARAADVVLISKDNDFIRLLERLGSPPKIIWLTCGNTSEAALQAIFTRHLPTTLHLLACGETLVEIGSP